MMRCTAACGFDVPHLAHQPQAPCRFPAETPAAVTTFPSSTNRTVIQDRLRRLGGLAQRFDEGPVGGDMRRSLRETRTVEEHTTRCRRSSPRNNGCPAWRSHLMRTGFSISVRVPHAARHENDVEIRRTSRRCDPAPPSSRLRSAPGRPFSAMLDDPPCRVRSNRTLPKDLPRDPRNRVPRPRRRAGCRTWYRPLPKPPRQKPSAKRHPSIPWGHGHGLRTHAGGRRSHCRGPRPMPQRKEPGHVAEGALEASQGCRVRACSASRRGW